ncbi:MAG: DMT family transporter [Xanthobacteraceae bacterium]
MADRAGRESEFVGRQGAPSLAGIMIAHNKKLGLALGLAGVCLFAGTLPATRLAVATINPLFLTAARAALAGCAGAILLLVLRRPLPPRVEWGTIVLGGFCTIVGFPVFTALAMVSVPAAHGGVVLGIMPLATAGAAAIVARERPSAGFWLAGVAGAAIVIAFVLSRREARTFAIGDVYLLITVLAGAFGYALSGRLSIKMPGWEVVSWQVTAFLPLSVLASFALWPPDLAAAPPAAWAGLAYVSFISQFFAFFVFNAAMAMIGVARVGQLMLLQPFVIVLLAVPVNGESIRLTTLAYAAAVVAVVVIGQRMRVRHD